MDQETSAPPFQEKENPQLNSQRFLFVARLSCPLSCTWMFDVVLFAFKVILKGCHHQPANHLQCIWLTEVPGCFVSPSQKPTRAPLNSTLEVTGQLPSLPSTKERCGPSLPGPE